MSLHSAGDLAAAQAAGAGVDVGGGPVDDGLDALHVRLPGTVGASVGVGNLNTESNALTTVITLRHSLHLQSEMITQKLRPNQALKYCTKLIQKNQVFFSKK